MTMENGKVRTLMLLWVFALCVHGQPFANHSNVIDLLAALNMSHPVGGVSRLQSPSGVMYKIRSRAPYLTLPHEYSHFLCSNLQGSMGLHLVGHQASGSTATLFSLSSSSSPILQITSSSSTLRLDYPQGGSQDLASLHFPRQNPFSRDEWVQLALSVEPDKLTFFVDCQEAVVLPIKSDARINLELPQDVVATLASTPGKKESKFSGYLKRAEISIRGYLKRPWHCDNVTDTPSQNTDTLNPDHETESTWLQQQDDSPTKPQIRHRPLDQTSQYPQDVQSDQQHRGVVLGPPGSPQGTRSGPQAQRDDKLRKLEKRLDEMARMLDMVKAQNSDLQSRVKYLEGCECVRRRCVWEGREVDDGQHWQIDINTICTCASGKVTCQSNIRDSLQMGVPVSDPCLSSPCQNGGVCFGLTSDPAGFHCSCPPNTEGPMCHRQLRKVSRAFQLVEVCWVSKPENSCEGVQPLQLRWAFNPTSLLCEDHRYCTGNTSNSFASFKACRDQCMLGACCHRTFKQEQEDHKGNFKKEEGFIRVDCIEDPDFIYSCDYLTLLECQNLVKDQTGLTQIMSFSPGMKCSDVTCGGGSGCFSSYTLWKHGKRMRQSSEESKCAEDDKGDCVCQHLTQRKEIRDLTLRERSLYQRAIRKLYSSPAVWKVFALLRAEFSPQAGDPIFFLPWHRYFLQLVEQNLQSVSSCKVSLPYFEWTVDTGSMLSSAAWQAGMFGGDGDPGSGCIRHHPFQDWASRIHWSPCLRRGFNSSVWLPDAVTVQQTINQADFQLFSRSLLTFSGLFRLWVGGHMASPLAAYDPLYLSHMAFMDKLWMQWQEKHQHISETYTSRDKYAQRNNVFPSRQRYMKMKPFDIAPNDVMSSQMQMCVLYVPITIGAPCNMTSSQIHSQGSHSTEKYPKYHTHTFVKHKLHHNRFISNSFDSSGFNQLGFDRDGYDKSGWDKWGYGKDSFNRDFIDRDGYDIFGFNRYGFNRSRMTWYGMSWSELLHEPKRKNHDGDEEKNERTVRDKIITELFNNKGYSVYGFNPFGLDRAGFDAFGFRIDGYDKDGCNWFFNGPHYLRFYFHTQQQLMSSSDQALIRISRTCPTITSLPKHWTVQDWMMFDPEESNAPHRQQEQESIVENKPGSLNNADALNRSRIWLPVTPDHRFCFKLHWFSGCPLGFPPITCPDLCHRARCHGYPKAFCHMHNCGSCFTEWRDPITGNHIICNDW